MPLLATVPLFLRLQENIALCRSFVCYFRSFFVLREFVSCVMYCFHEVFDCPNHTADMRIFELCVYVVIIIIITYYDCFYYWCC